MKHVKNVFTCRKSKFVRKFITQYNKDVFEGWQIKIEENKKNYYLLSVHSVYAAFRFGNELAIAEQNA